MLKVAGASVATAAGSGLAAANPDDRVEVNIGFDSERGRQAALNQADETVREFDSIDVLTLRLPKQAATALENRGDVRYVEENGTMHALAQTLPWGIDRVDAEIAHANGDTGAGADIAIVDSGIDADHPDLQANLGEGEAFTKCRGGQCNESWDDDNDHGTHCAGTAGAVDNAEGVVGVSTQATLHAVKVLDKRGSGSFSDIAAGIEYVADQGWDVANLSLGASSGSQAIEDACAYADDRGVLLVGAAGGSGPCSDGCVGYPAAYSEVVAVSATDESDTLASFSSRGPEIELAAPGADLRTVSSGDGCDALSGTSYAAAHVSGVGALLAGEGYTNTDARVRMRDTATDIGLPSDEQGYGLVDAAAALGVGSSDE
nr:S8 family peptidase [Halorussus amylolyticus]